MFDFCPNCGNTLGGQKQAVGQMVVCPTCGHQIGVVQAPPQKVVVDRTEEILQSGTAARCPACHQVVELKTSSAGKSFVPHFQAGQRKMCPGSGKLVAEPKEAPVPTPQQQSAKGKDLSAHYHREFIKVIACRKDGDPTIEQLTLEYLDKSDRVRLQIDALRDILGKAFAMKPYPSELKRPHLAVWGNAAMCVIAKKQSEGGYQLMDDVELPEVVAEVRGQKGLFF